MQDVSITRNKNGVFDLTVENGRIKSVDGFETAIATSILTDARAEPFQQPNPLRRRGWAGNVFDIEHSLGSTIWTYKQARLTPDIVNLIALSAKSALFWLVTDGFAKSLDVTAEKVGQSRVDINVIITENNGASRKITLLWDQTNGFDV